MFQGATGNEVLFDFMIADAILGFNLKSKMV